ncbi:RIP metalloprotease RseP, partial [Patescibacteria group bacterium]|nr:RIP metalloprotease RseP [Patescibacteria group bacterium]
MTIFLSIIAFLIIFSLLILIHELGHFWMAKRAGVKVTEFGIGMPPRIWGKKVGDTEYTVNWIPFGGFVRMHGDDPKNENLITDPKSFVGKPLRQRIKIVVAGVLMNFLLAWFLLSIGFAVGMEPFIVTADDAVQAIDDGLIDLKHGVLVKEVEEESIAYEVGLEVGDIITAVNGQEVKTYDDLDTLFSEGTTEGFSIDVRKGSTLQNIKIDREVDESIGVEFERLVFLTRPMVQSVKIGSLSEQAGFRKGDLILSVNGKGIYSIADYLTVVRTNSKLSYTVLRSFNEREVIVDLGKTRFAHITDVGAASAAAIAGFEVGDIITEIDGAAIDSIDEIIELGEANAGSELSYTLHRNGNDIKVNATPNQHGKLGIGLSPILYHGDYDLDLSLQVVPASIMSMGEVSYPIYTAPFHALSESWRLTKFTASM